MLAGKLGTTADPGPTPWANLFSGTTASCRLELVEWDDPLVFKLDDPA